MEIRRHGDQVVIYHEPQRRGQCSVVKWSLENERLNLFVGFATGKIASYSLVNGIIRRSDAVSVGIAVQCLKYKEGILLVGDIGGGLRLIPIDGGTKFKSDVSLWPSINSKTSPGLTSLDICVMEMSSNDSRCVCTTAGEDGSIALFEIREVLRN